MRPTKQQMTDALDKARQARLEREARGAPKFLAECADEPPPADEQGMRQYQEDWERYCEALRQWCEANSVPYPYKE